MQHVCSITYECYPIFYTVSSLFIVECNILYWCPVSKRIMIVSMCHTIHMYQPTSLWNELNALYVTIVKFHQAYLHVCHGQINFLELTRMRCNSSCYLKTLITCNVFTQMYHSQYYLLKLYFYVCR